MEKEGHYTAGIKSFISESLGEKILKIIHFYPGHLTTVRLSFTKSKEPLPPAAKNHQLMLEKLPPFKMPMCKFLQAGQGTFFNFRW